MADVSMNLKEFNVEFDDTNISKSANIVSGHDIKESFATIHKRLNNIGYTLGTEKTIINSNADLDDYYNYGIYQCNNTSLTITHAPIAGMFKLYVISVAEGQGGASRIAQYFLPVNENCIYVRYQDNTWDPGVWNDWKRLGEQVILSYGNSTWDDFYNAYIHNAVVYCRASSNSNPASGTQTRMAFMAYVNNGADPTEVEFQYYRSVSSHTDSQQGDQVYVYKLNKNSGWSVTTRNAFSPVKVSAPIIKSYSNQEITLSHADSGATAGTYDSVTIDAKGHVTSGNNNRVSNVNYDITNTPILTQTIGGATSTILTCDTIPTVASKNLVTSGGILNWVYGKTPNEIASNSDLNDYYVPGTYCSTGDEITDTLSNCPFTGSGFKLEVISTVASSNTGYQIQRIYPNNDSQIFYMRRRLAASSGEWDPWAAYSSCSITNNSTINIGTNTFTPIAFATCDTAAGTKDKVATITGNSTWTRTIGSIVAVKYSNTNTYDANNTTSGTGSITLNVNGTGAANIYYGSTANPTGTNTAAFGYANRYIYYMWDGTYWVWLSQSTDNNTTYSGMTAAEIRAGTSTSARLITPANLNLANYGLGTALKADDDLNSTSIIPVTRGNRYYGSSTQICKSIKHRPDYANSGNVVFMIETKITTSATSGSERMIMIMYTRNTTTNDTNIYYRSYGGTWGSWKQVTDSTVSDYVPS